MRPTHRSTLLTGNVAPSVTVAVESFGKESSSASLAFCDAELVYLLRTFDLKFLNPVSKVMKRLFQMFFLKLEFRTEENNNICLSTRVTRDGKFDLNIRNLLEQKSTKPFCQYQISINTLPS